MCSRSERRDTLSDALALVGVCHAHRRCAHVVDDLLVGTCDVDVARQSGAHAHEGAVGLQAQASGIGDERVARDAGGLVVGLAEAAVDHQQLTVRSHRRVAVHLVYGRVTVDDVRQRA